MNRFLLFSTLVFFLCFARADQDVVSDEPRSIILFPVLTALVPGLGQAIDGQYLKSASLLGLTLSGVLIAEDAREKQKTFLESDSLRFHGYRDIQHAVSVGSAMTKHAFGIALYDSFLNRVSDYHHVGKYQFLPEKQNLKSIHTAPFEFSYLSRPTTFIPLVVGFGLATSEFNRPSRPDHFELRVSDVAASTSISYVAGVSEEAMFRGWMQPILFENTQNFWVANTIQAVAFGYSHDNAQPYFQIAFGLYTGWLTPKNNWDLSEAIFIHTWWDVIVITAEFVRTRSKTEDFNIQLPAFSASF